MTAENDANQTPMPVLNHFGQGIHLYENGGSKVQLVLRPGGVHVRSDIPGYRFDREVRIPMLPDPGTDTVDDGPGDGGVLVPVSFIRAAAQTMRDMMRRGMDVDAMAEAVVIALWREVERVADENEAEALGVQHAKDAEGTPVVGIQPEPDWHRFDRIEQQQRMLQELVGGVMNTNTDLARDVEVTLAGLQRIEQPHANLLERFEAMVKLWMPAHDIRLLTDGLERRLHDHEVRLDLQSDHGRTLLDALTPLVQSAENLALSQSQIIERDELRAGEVDTLLDLLNELAARVARTAAGVDYIERWRTTFNDGAHGFVARLDSAEQLMHGVASLVEEHRQAWQEGLTNVGMRLETLEVNTGTLTTDDLASATQEATAKLASRLTVAEDQLKVVGETVLAMAKYVHYNGDQQPVDLPALAARVEDVAKGVQQWRNQRDKAQAAFGERLQRFEHQLKEAGDRITDTNRRVYKLELTTDLMATGLRQLGDVVTDAVTERMLRASNLPDLRSAAYTLMANLKSACTMVVGHLPEEDADDTEDDGEGPIVGQIAN